VEMFTVHAPPGGGSATACAAMLTPLPIASTLRGGHPP
jgi:hypothetical protein